MAKRIFKVEDISPRKFSVGVDIRGYKFYGVLCDGKLYVIAGCHKFLLPSAREYWSEPGYSKRAGCTRDSVLQKSWGRRAGERLPHIIRMLDAIEAEAIKRKWLRKPRKAAS